MLENTSIGPTLVLSRNRNLYPMWAYTMTIQQFEIVYKSDITNQGRIQTDATDADASVRIFLSLEF